MEKEQQKLLGRMSNPGTPSRDARLAQFKHQNTGRQSGSFSSRNKVMPSPGLPYTDVEQGGQGVTNPVDYTYQTEGCCSRTKKEQYVPGVTKVACAKGSCGKKKAFVVYDNFKVPKPLVLGEYLSRRITVTLIALIFNAYVSRNPSLDLRMLHCET